MAANARDISLIVAVKTQIKANELHESYASKQVILEDETEKNRKAKQLIVCVELFKWIIKCEVTVY